MNNLKNSQQINYVMDYSNSYADRKRNSPNCFKEKAATIVALICR
jgi:hypothetical protein